jgi:phenylacetate-CoA ligase
MGDAVGSSLLRLSLRLRSSNTLDLLDSIRGEPFVTRETALARQLERVRELVSHCAVRVPYYRRLFREINFKPVDLRSLEDFGTLPVLTKAIVAEHADDLIAEGTDKKLLLAHHSGGSTGVPLKFYRDSAYVAASEAGTYRNLLQSGWSPGEMIGFFWGWNDRLTAMHPLEFEVRQALRRMYQFDPFRSGEADMRGWWRRWRRVKPRVALGYASTIARFARYMRDEGHRPPPLKGVFTTAERLFPQQRELLEDVFGCRVYDCYGSSEVQNIATECSHGSMHVNTDFVVVEVDRSDTAAGPAPLLVTSLKNRVMPFLRYRNEDWGELADGECTCGSGFPLMSLNVARVSDNFRLPGGRVVHGEFFTHLLYGAEGVDSFQFHQTAENHIVLRYVPSPRGDAARQLAKACQQVQSLAPGRISVELDQVASIPLSAAGKHRFTRSDVK